MGSSFFVGLSGLTSNSLGLRVVGNNLANSNSIGYKSNNLFLQELVFAGSQFGRGVLAPTLQQVWAQGNIAQSQIATDMAIQGSGFFIVGNQNGQFYTRAGNFLIGPDGRLMTPDGFDVLGYPVNATGAIDLNSPLTSLDLSPGKVIPPRETSLVRFKTNLNSETAVGEVFSTSAIVFDSLGQSHSVLVEFTKTAPGWDYQMTVPAEDVGGLPSDPPVVVNSGSMTFDNQGILTTPAADITGITISGFSNGAADLTFDWNLYGSSGESFLTQFNLPSATSETFQDGKSAGTLTSFIVRKDGVIEGLFSNGESEPLGQLAVANFSNLQGMAKAKNGLFAQTLQSGEPSIGEAGTGGRGEVLGNALENSNVDIAEEFIRLILFQRGYQANSRVITTADEITQEALNLKR